MQQASTTVNDMKNVGCKNCATVGNNMET